MFLPILIRDALQGTAVNFSTAVTAFGLGGLAGAIVLLGMSPSTDRRLLATASATFYGLITVLASLDPWLTGLPVLMLLGGVAMTFSNTSVNTLLQTRAPTSLRGRTVSFYMVAMRGGLSLGGLMTGATAHVFGVQKRASPQWSYRYRPPDCNRLEMARHHRIGVARHCSVKNHKRVHAG